MGRGFALALLLILSGGCSLGGGCCRWSCCEPSGQVRGVGVHASFGTRALRVRQLPRWIPAPAPQPVVRPHVLEEKLHPMLRGAFDTTNGPDLIRVVVTYRDRPHAAPLPEPIAPAPRDPRVRRPRPAAEATLPGKTRANDFVGLSATLRHRYGGARIHDFRLARAQAVTLPRDSVRSLAAWGEVVYVEPARSGEGPPANETSTKTARKEVGADVLLGMGLGGGWIALLDTGVMFDHVLFDRTPSPFHGRWDCVDGDSLCRGGRPGEALPGTNGHGTGAAALIVGEGSLGNRAFRGLTKAQLGSYRVYEDTVDAEDEDEDAGEDAGKDTTVRLNVEAAARALDRAVIDGNRVIVVEAQGAGAPHSVLSTQADAAFDSGAVVVAAVGNLREDSLGAPGNARRVVAVGAWELDREQPSEDQSFGTTREDARSKPDLTAPTGFETASAEGPDAETILPETSGSTPIAGAMALLLRNFLGGGGGSVEPGAVVATMLASTQVVTGKVRARAVGAGRLRFPKDAVVWWDAVDLAHGEVAEWELDLSGIGGARRLEVAAWWPEKAQFDPGGFLVDSHNNIDLDVTGRSDGGSVRTESHHEAGVFERAHVDLTETRATTWRIRLKGTRVLDSPQRVYWTAIASD